MVVIACTPCLASTLGPTALSVATFVGLNNTDKKKNKKKNKKKKGGGKKQKNNKRGGSGYETQEDHEAMIREQNESMNEDRIRIMKQKQKEKERMNMELRRLLIRQEDMRKECDKLVRLLKSKGVSEQVAEKYAQEMFRKKLQCDDGYLQSCNYCKDEYLKNQRTSKKRSKTPRVPQEALPKSKSRSQPRRTTRRRKGPPESISMKLHAMGRTQRLKNLKKSLTKRSPPPPIRRSKSKSKLKRTKSTGGKRSKRSK